MVIQIIVLQGSNGQKDSGDMAYSVYPDQTAPYFAQTCLSQCIDFYGYILFHMYFTAFSIYVIYIKWIIFKRWAKIRAPGEKPPDLLQAKHGFLTCPQAEAQTVGSGRPGLKTQTTNLVTEQAPFVQSIVKRSTH